MMVSTQFSHLLIELTIVQMLLTFFLVVIGWVIFRAESISQAWDYLCRMFSSSLFTFPDKGRIALIYSLILLTVEWFQRDKQHALYMNGIKHKTIRWCIYCSLVIAIILFAGKVESFIYFQF
jgi:hypothetical protein